MMSKHNIPIANVLNTLLDTVSCTMLTELLIVGHHAEPGLNVVAQDIVDYSVQQSVYRLDAAKHRFLLRRLMFQ